MYYYGTEEEKIDSSLKKLCFENFTIILILFLITVSTYDNVKI